MGIELCSTLSGLVINLSICGGVLGHYSSDKLQTHLSTKSGKLIVDSSLSVHQHESNHNEWKKVT